MRNYTKIILICLSIVLINIACAPKKARYSPPELVVTYKSNPEGAEIYGEDGSYKGRSPIRLHYSIDATKRKRGYINVAGLKAQWPSGHTESFDSEKFYLDQSGNTYYTYTFKKVFKPRSRNSNDQYEEADAFDRSDAYDRSYALAKDEYESALSDYNWAIREQSKNESDIQMHEGVIRLNQMSKKTNRSAINLSKSLISLARYRRSKLASAVEMARQKLQRAKEKLNNLER